MKKKPRMAVQVAENLKADKNNEWRVEAGGEFLRYDKNNLIT
jgi:hypothetical protein